MSSMLQTDSLQKHYQMGNAVVRALDGVTISILGGLAGVILGWAVGRAINFGANISIRNQGGEPGNLFSLPFWLIGGAVGFSIAISLAAGLYPASRAARLDPIHALRHD